MLVCTHGKLVCWDRTCVYTFASTHLNGSAVNFDQLHASDVIKRTKYRPLTNNYQFEVVATETAGTYSAGTSNINRDNNYMFYEGTRYQREGFWLMQKLRSTAQRYISASTLCAERERLRCFGCWKSFKNLGRGLSGPCSQLNTIESLFDNEILWMPSFYSWRKKNATENLWLQSLNNK